MAEPIAVQVTRHRCPHCTRSYSSKTRAVAHIARCWNNPEARGCRTCEHFVPFQPAGCDGPEEPEHCAVGVALPEVERDYGTTTTLMINCDRWE